MGLTIPAGIVAEGGMIDLLTKMNGNTVKLTDEHTRVAFLNDANLKGLYRVHSNK